MTADEFEHMIMGWRTDYRAAVMVKLFQGYVVVMPWSYPLRQDDGLLLCIATLRESFLLRESKLFRFERQIAYIRNAFLKLLLVFPDARNRPLFVFDPRSEIDSPIVLEAWDSARA